MFEDIFEFLEPALNVVTAVVVVSLGIALCTGCIMLAVKACGRFSAFVKARAAKAFNLWVSRTDNIVERIGERIERHLNVAIRNPKSLIRVDLRPCMVGEWISDSLDFMTISRHDGYYKVTFDGSDIPAAVLKQEFILRDIQGWLHDDNVYCAESQDLLTLGVSDNVDEIFVAELKQTFHKKPETEKLPFSQHDILCEKSIVLSEELRKRVVDIVAGKHDNGNTTPKAATEPVNINIIE